MINILPSKLRFFLETTKKKAENLQAISKLRNAPAHPQAVPARTIWRRALMPRQP